LGHDFAIRHNIVKIYGVDTFRTSFLLCAETTHNLTTAQLKVLFEIKDLFSNMDQNNIIREYNYFKNKGE
jgi:hypothetical protein